MDSDAAKSPERPPLVPRADLRRCVRLWRIAAASADVCARRVWPPRCQRGRRFQNAWRRLGIGRAALACTWCAWATGRLLVASSPSGCALIESFPWREVEGPREAVR